MTCITAKRLKLGRLGLALAACSLGFVSAPAPASAQIPALLPSIDQVKRLDPLSIDGVWVIREVGQSVIIEGGHAYAEDGWVHMFVFRILPEQVVIKNIRELANGDFVAQDLPLMANVTMERIDPDIVRVTTEGLIPIVYHLDRVGGFGGFDEGFDRPFPPSAPRSFSGDDEPLIDLPKDDEEVVEPW